MAPGQLQDQSIVPQPGGRKLECRKKRAAAAPTLSGPAGRPPVFGLAWNVEARPSWPTPRTIGPVHWPGIKMQRMKVFCRTIMIALTVLSLPAAAAGSPDPLFEDDAALNVVITAPLSTLLRARPEEPPLAGVFSYREADGTSVELDLQISARGNFRKRTCDFPPLNLNFKKSQVEGTLFDRQDKLKVVSHCKDSRRYEQTVLREYLAYRILNSLTELSFQVRLLQVTYVDIDERRPRMVRSAFLIEHKDRLADRIGRKSLDIVRTEVSALQPDYLNLTSMFQFLIGNTDFSPNLGSNNECCHNHEMFGNDAEPMLAIPYDFDLAGLVNAPYAMPDPELGIESVRQRLYRGFCVNNGHVEATLGRFVEARDALYALVADREELELTVRENMARYMDGFYEIIGDPGEVERQITGKCI